MKTLRHSHLLLLAAGLTLGPANAQTGTDTSGTTTSINRADDRRGFDYGWLGLLGLAGLLGLRKPNIVTDTRSSMGANRV